MSFGTENGFCAQTATLWQFVGYILLIMKIIVPAALIIIGIITLGKAVISSEEKDMKNGVKSMIKKFITAVIIFFIPTIVSALFGFVRGFDEVKEDYTVCSKCISNPRSNYCETKVSTILDEGV